MVELQLAGRRLRLDLGSDVVIFPAGRSGEAIEADIVIGGYGLDIPGTDHDDFLGPRVADSVLLSALGWPRDAPQPAAAYAALFDGRREAIVSSGARGVLSIAFQSWDRVVAQFGELDMDLSEDEISLFEGVGFWGILNPKSAALDFGEGAVKALANGGRRAENDVDPEVRGKLFARVNFDETPVESQTVIGIIEGTLSGDDAEYVVLVAHLDGYGIDESLRGDSIYNGAMDNAAGVATLIQAAESIASSSHQPRRSIVFLVSTAEEKGMLGVRYFLSQWPVNISQIAAVLTVDTPLPLGNFESVWGWGLHEAGLGPTAKHVASRHGVTVNTRPPGADSAEAFSEYLAELAIELADSAEKFAWVNDSMFSYRQHE